MSEYTHWEVCLEGHIATLTLNRPGAMNSLTAGTLYELRNITAGLLDEHNIWVVILQGAGKHFSAGMDINMIQGRLDQSEADNRAFLLGLQSCLDDFEALEKPTIAKLKGFCIGGGLILALCCDFRIASQRTIFALPEVRLGLAIMGTRRVIQVVGVAATKEIVLLGGRFKAKDALDYGLVNHVVPPGELDAAVETLAERFLALPPRTVGISKRIINQGQDLSLQDGQDLEIDAQMEMLNDPDAHEAMHSYIEKRQPRFTGE